MAKSPMVFSSLALAVHEDVQRKYLEGLRVVLKRHGVLGYHVISKMTY